MSNTFNTIPHFKFWCQKVLPLVYDESLSYYELLNKVIYYLNNMVDDINMIPDYIKTLLSDENLKEYLDEIMGEIRTQIARVDEGKNETASADRTKGELVWLDGELVRMTRDILAGDRYVEETSSDDDITGNYVKTSVEIEINRVRTELNTDINDVIATIGSLSDLTTSDKDSVVEAINSVLSDLSNIIGDLENLNTDVKTDIVSAINSALSELNTTIGDLTDLNTEDKSDIVSAINEVLSMINTSIMGLHIYNLYSNAVSDVANLSDGDVFTTKGFSQLGVGAGTYKVHDTSTPYYIELGTKYAELIPIGDTIDFDSLGAVKGFDVSIDNSPLMNTAIELVKHINAISNISAGYKTGGLKIKFSFGGYRFGTSIVIDAPFGSVDFIGSGERVSLLFDGDEWLFTFNGTASETIDHLLFKDLNFQGTGSIINASYLSFTTFDHCTFMNRGSGLSITRAVGIWFENCILSTGSYGAIIGDITTTVYFNNCGIRFNNYGISITGGSSDITLRDCIVEYNTTYGIYVEADSKITLNNIWSEGNACSFNDCDIIANNINIYPGSNAEPYIWYFNKGDNKHYINVTDIDTSVTFNSTLVSDWSGIFRDRGGYEIDFTHRKVTTVNATILSIGSFTSAGQGLMEVNGDSGSFIGSFNYQYNVDFTVTKIGGSLASITTNPNGLITIPSNSIFTMSF